MMRIVRLLLLFLLSFPVTAAFAQTGKIAGRVVDTTGDPLPGVNILIEGTQQGAVSDIDGYYTILNVRPGTYELRASFIGFTPAVVQEVRVNIDLTTEVNFELQEETVGLDEVVVSAVRPVVQRDVSASIANIDSEQIENLPLSSVAEVISLQAGFEPGLTVRGSGGNQVAFALDGVALTDPRSNNPNTEISYTAISEVQVQTGGFNAEYGNVRSGLINVVTKDPDRSRYNFDFIARYSSPSRKNFTDWGTDYGDVNAATFMAYPRLSTDKYPGDGNGDGVVDPGEMCEVSICGVSILPGHLRTQYEQFGGWRSLAAGDITPEQLRKGQEWVFRKDFSIQDPDYQVDGTLSGPVPGIGPMLGDLRFSASFRQSQDAMLNPMQRTAETRRTFQGKLVSDISRGMRVVMSGIHNDIKGLAVSHDGNTPTDYRNISVEMPGYPWDNRDYLEASYLDGQHVFGDYFWSPHDHKASTYGLELTHTLSPTTFYKVQVQRNASDDLTGAPDYRTLDAEGNSLIVRCVTPDLQLREATNGTCAANEVPLSELPFGLREPYEYYGGQSFGSQEGDARDTSKVVRWSGRFDITSQVNRFMQIKTGVEFLYSDYDVFYGSWDPANPHQENQRYRWERSPVQGAVYAQSKLEFQGMIANLGLRADYFHAGGEWYKYDAFSTLFSASRGYDVLDQAETEPTEHKFSLSPRLGLSFPVTDNSKFYFNYGHFRQMPDPYRLFEIEYGAYTTQITRIGNPNIALPKTVAYEIGFEQNLANMFLVRLAGFYRDLSAGGRDVSYVSIDGLVNYTRQEPLGYADNRGFEITLEKNRGDWVRGFINYTYLSTKGGGFGWGQVNEDLRQFRQYTTNPNNLLQNARVPEPYANMNLELVLPQEFGPEVAGVNPLANWRIALLGEWRSGAPSTWDGSNFSLRGPGSDRRIAYNVKWKDFWNFDLRFSKAFQTSLARAQFYIDVTNVFNFKHMYWRNGALFQGDNDARDYFRSLHLPTVEKLFEGVDNPTPGYVWVPGNDRPGAYRKPGVDFQPIEGRATLPEAPESGKEQVWIWAQDTDQYSRWTGSGWERVPQDQVDKVIKDKAYIDMPNGHVMGFLNPRDVYFGIRLSF